jgi:multidrug efflux pump
MILKPWDERKRSSLTLKPLVQNELSKVEGVNAFAFNLPALPGGPGGLPIQMVISTTSGFQAVFEQMEKLKKAARESGFFIVADSDLAFNQPVVTVTVDRSKANDMGINMSAVGNTLSTLLGGNYVNRFNLEGRSYQVIPQVPRELRLTPESLANYYVATSSGRQVPLSTIVTIETATNPNALTHFNQLNSATFQAVAMPGVTVGKAVEFLESRRSNCRRASPTTSRGLAAICAGRKPAHGDFRVRAHHHLPGAGGAVRKSARSAVILISVPMAISGALIPLFFGLATINIYTQVGLVTLVGLISKHGILMVEFANEMQVNENVDRRTAITHSARVRLRPILMTTAAMVAGLLPLLTASGAGAASRFSIGIVVVAGMSIGTLFTLFVLPAVYTWIATDHRAAAQNQRAKDIEKYELSLT